jgi:dUTP pyrophosphatase
MEQSTESTDTTTSHETKANLGAETLKDRVKIFAGFVEKFVENNVVEKHQREENMRKLALLFEATVKDNVMKPILSSAIAKAMSAAAQMNAAAQAATAAQATSSDTQGASGLASVTVQVKKLENFKGELPKYQTSLASGLDVRAQLEAPIEVAVGQRVLVPTGLAFAIPAGYEIQARPRSGWAIRDGVSLLNTPGTIDADYRGEVKIILINLGDKTIKISDQDRIAQLVLCPVLQAQFQEVETLDETVRGAGGFGSTGRG